MDCTLQLVGGGNTIEVEFAFESNLDRVRSRPIVVSDVIFKLKVYHLIYDKLHSAAKFCFFLAVR